MADQDLSHLDTFESLRRFLYKIAEYEESLRLEILALRATLETYANPKSPEDPPLEETVMLLKNDPIVKRLVHRDFEEVIHQIDGSIQEGKLNTLLSSWIPKGPVN